LMTSCLWLSAPSALSAPGPLPFRLTPSSPLRSLRPPR
jgi:hypothetical protein